MKAAIIAGCVLLSVLGVPRAHAEQYSKDYQARFLPPKEFDHEYKEGLVRINRGTERCPKTSAGLSPLGCAGRTLHQETGLEACVIWIADDSVLQKNNVDFKTVLRHEIGHCNGWHHN
jgi:hypothetical protein